MHQSTLGCCSVFVPLAELKAAACTLSCSVIKLDIRACCCRAGSTQDRPKVQSVAARADMQCSSMLCVAGVDLTAEGFQEIRWQ